MTRETCQEILCQMDSALFEEEGYHQGKLSRLTPQATNQSPHQTGGQRGSRAGRRQEELKQKLDLGL